MLIALEKHKLVAVNINAIVLMSFSLDTKIINVFCLIQVVVSKNKRIKKLFDGVTQEPNQYR